MTEPALASNAEIIDWFVKRKFGQGWTTARLVAVTGLKAYQILDAMNGTIWRPTRARMTQILSMPESALPQPERRTDGLYLDGMIAWEYARILWFRHDMRTKFNGAQLFDADRSGQRRIRWWCEWTLKTMVLRQYSLFVERLNLWDGEDPKTWEDLCVRAARAHYDYKSERMPRRIMPANFQLSERLDRLGSSSSSVWSRGSTPEA